MLVTNKNGFAVLEYTKQGVFIFDSFGKLYYMNTAACKILENFGRVVPHINEDELSGLCKDLPTPVNVAADLQEVECAGKLFQITRQYITLEDEDLKLWQLYDITSEKKRIADFNRHTSNMLWKSRTRITSVQNVLTLLTEFSPIVIDETIEELLNDTRFEMMQLERHLDTYRDCMLVNAHILSEDLQLESINLYNIVVDVQKEMVQLFANSGKEIHIDFDATDPELYIVGDRIRCLWVVQAVIMNAIVYSNGNAKVTIRIEKGGEGMVSVIIGDEGIGIPDADQNRVFTYLFRARNTDKIAYDGMGIELFLSRHIMAKLDGTISFVSKENNGTVFDISFKEAGDSWRR